MNVQSNCNSHGKLPQIQSTSQRVAKSITSNNWVVEIHYWELKFLPAYDKRAHPWFCFTLLRTMAQDDDDDDKEKLHTDSPFIFSHDSRIDIGSKII